MYESYYLSVKAYIAGGAEGVSAKWGRDFDLCTAASPVPKHLSEHSRYPIKISFVVCQTCFIHVVSLKHKYS